MTSLIFYTDSDNAIIASDSEGISVKSNDVWAATKVYSIPHLNMVVAGTGLSTMLGRWIALLNYKHGAVDVDSLNENIPPVLKALWLDENAKIAGPLPQAASIYHFGIRKSDQRVSSYVYRSEDGFISESLSYGLGLHPAFTPAATSVFPRDVLEIMRGQIECVAKLPKDQFIHIGGQSVVTHLTKDGFTISSAGRL